MEIKHGVQIVVIDKSYKKQLKTSRFKLLNWLLGKIYGYEKIYFIEDGQTIFMDNKLYMNPNTYKSLSVELMEQNK